MSAAHPPALMTALKRCVSAGREVGRSGSRFPSPTQTLLFKLVARAALKLIVNPTERGLHELSSPPLLLLP